MALGSFDHGAGSPPRRSRRSVVLVVIVVALLAVLVGAGVVLALAASSKPSLSADPSALARVNVPQLAGTLERASASADGKPLALIVRDGRITPEQKLTPGELVSVEVVIRRPGWLSWALGSTREEYLKLRAPQARISERWLTLAAGAPLRLHFDQPLAAVAAGPASHLEPHLLDDLRRTLSLGTQPASGSVEVAAAARSWERLGPPQTVTWFPPSQTTVALTSPAPATPLAPTTPIRLTFSRPLTDVFTSNGHPTLDPATPGSWRAIDSHTLQFTPSGTGYPLASSLHVVLPAGISTLTSASATPKPTTTIDWAVAPGTTLRLQQLLAEQGYLPVDWTAASTTTPIARTALAQTTAAVSPPAGTFGWRYANTPAELQALWKPGEANIITRGAVMAFEHNHDLAADGIAGPDVWHALLEAAIAGTQLHTPYSYVYVHRSLPQSLTLWSAGHKVLSSPGNTGIPESPTKLGTFAVFEHVVSGTMKGTNPDGTKYNDPDVRFISYFNGGDALHAFPRASYGTPQSLGCVELPLAAAQKVWPYTPIGTLVTIEN
jgi:peptidoglycan hydrolase-like protein with peptidoglycan-binding domain